MSRAQKKLPISILRTEVPNSRPASAQLADIFGQVQALETENATLKKQLAAETTRANEAEQLVDIVRRKLNS
jgi:hypothetical protein